MKLRKFVMILAGVVCMSASALAAPADTITVRRAFVDLPVNVLDILKRSTRLDMLDYYDVDSIYSAPNSMEGYSKLIKVTDSYLSLEITPVSTLQIKILKGKKGNDYVMTVYTVGDDGQAPDSDVRFFDSSLNELPRDKFFKLPDLKEFFDIPKGSLTTMKEIEQMVPFPTVEYTVSPDSETMTGKLTVGAYMNVDDYNIVKLFEKPQVNFRWKPDKLQISN